MPGFETFRGVAYPWHCDSMGHMNTQFYSALFDGATLHALSRLARSDELAAAGLGWADVKQVIEYKHEVASGTLLVVKTEFIRCGRTSMSYRHHLLGAETGDLHATSEQTTVLFDLKERRSVEITEAMRKAFDASAEHGLAEHS
jgi:acyl-CoA thioester hydrolase